MVKISFRVRYQELLPPHKATPVHRKKNEKTMDINYLHQVVSYLVYSVRLRNIIILI